MSTTVLIRSIRGIDRNIAFRTHKIAILIDAITGTSTRKVVYPKTYTERVKAALKLDREITLLTRIKRDLKTIIKMTQTPQQPTTIEDEIGQAVIQLVKAEEDIQQLEFMKQGALHPEELGAYHEQLHEKREQRVNLRKEIARLKTQLQSKMRSERDELQTNLDSPTFAMDAFDVQEAESHIRQMNMRLADLDQQIKMYNA